MSPRILSLTSVISGFLAFASTPTHAGPLYDAYVKTETALEHATQELDEATRRWEDTRDEQDAVFKKLEEKCPAAQTYDEFKTCAEKL